MPEHNLVTSLIVPPWYQPIGEVSHPAVLPHLAGKPIGKCYSTGKGLTPSLWMLLLPHLLSALSHSSLHAHTHIHREHSGGNITMHSKNPFPTIRLLAVIHRRIPAGSGDSYFCSAVSVGGRSFLFEVTDHFNSLL